jgi:hypothetical protein
MTDFTVTITDPLELEGITWAREQYNATIPPPPPPPDTVMGGMSVAPPMAGLQSTATPIETDAEYVQWVMSQAAMSYADQKLRWEHQQNYEAARSGGGGT